MVKFDTIDIGTLDYENYSHRMSIDEKRYRELTTCLSCDEREIFPECHPFCKICHGAKVKDFPEKFFPREKVFTHFCALFDKQIKIMQKKPKWIKITIPVPFKVPFTVIDVEATGDMHKNKSHFVITMGYLNARKAIIYQLIDTDKHKEFAKKCKAIGYQLPPPVVAYHKDSEMVWLKLFRWGWVELMNHEIDVSKEGKILAKHVSLDNITFNWDDVTGNDVIGEWQKYVKGGNRIHLKRIAYHNFIDLLKEYQVALKSMKVRDYLHGKT